MEKQAGGNGGRHHIGNGLGQKGGLRRHQGGQQQQAGQKDALAEQGAEQGQPHMAQGGGLIHQGVLHRQRQDHGGKHLDIAHRAVNELRVLEKQPDNYKAMAFSALNKIQFKDFDKALEEINTAMAHLPQDPFLLYIAGRIRFLRGEYEDAKIFLVKSYEMEPDSDTKNLLALCYYELEDYKQAVTIFRSILDKSPMNVNVLVSCAKCYEKLGDIEMALQHLEKAVEIFPECEEAHEMIRALS